MTGSFLPMKRCIACGMTYKDDATLCLKCNLLLPPQPAKPTPKPATPRPEPFDPHKLDRKIQHDFVQDLSKKTTKVSVQHPLPDNTNIKI